MNRNSTPEASTASSLRPPASRAAGTGSNLRASADMAALTGSSAAGRIRPSSDFYGQQGQGQGIADVDSQQDTVTQQWIADIDQYERTLEEMATATLDQDFKDELSAIEQWFRVLAEAERTAALYALLKQTTQVQIRFFIQVLQQMDKNHPMSGVLSPANFDKDPMSSRLTEAMNKLNVGSARNSLSQPQASAKRHSGLDPSAISSMFPDAAAAIATEKARFTQSTNQPPPNRNSVAVDPRSSLAAPTISAPSEGIDASGQNANSPWGNSHDQAASRPKSSSSGQPPMGQFVQPPPSAGLRSPRPQLGGSSNIQSTTLNVPDKSGSELPLLSPYATGNGSWASMVNTPMTSTFSPGNAPPTQADMVANAQAMKLAALSTVNNRFALDDVRKYRRARSNDGNVQNQGGVSAGPQLPNIPGTNIVMVNEHGQVLRSEQMLGLQNPQQIMGSFAAHRSRPNSPGIALQSAGFPQQIPFASPQNNRFLTTYDGQNPLLSGGFPGISMAQLGVGVPPEGYLSDPSDLNRGRSPRGRRGTSKPPEDPTDPTLLQDIPAWLRSLRLHKYTDNLKDMKWTDLIELDDEALEQRGVNALGARRKMLKVFEQVKGKDPVFLHLPNRN
ncbi:hypothetical protein NUW58_g8090 [Xylaria curta]|uniref:Uncharacterized protein n=1 Tax=Xylaria curta TaxID=42375 RepID=A0ACC1NDD7_9PEZI|nr:hypothetical protein NUW58_g8090 [Xylaria curta]